MVMQYFLSGFMVKLIAGFDDAMTHIPIIANLTKTKKGRFAFALGMFCSISLVIGLAFLFASSIRSVPYARYISSGLIFLLAMTIYFDLFVQKPKKEIRREVRNVKRISTKRFLKLIGIGFLTAFATIIDDTIAYSGLFLSTTENSLFVIAGIFTGTIIELTAITRFSKKLQKIPYKKEITTIGLIILSSLIFFRVL